MILHHSDASFPATGGGARQASRVRIGATMLVVIVLMLGALNLATSLA